LTETETQPTPDVGLSVVDVVIITPEYAETERQTDQYNHCNHTDDRRSYDASQCVIDVSNKTSTTARTLTEIYIQGQHIVARRILSDVTKLIWDGLVCEELTNGRARLAHWSLFDAYVTVM